MKSIAIISALFAANVYALPLLSVPDDVWQSLNASERATIQQSYLVETVPSGSYGLLLDNQAVDRSDPGTNGGATLGSAVAQATYIDRAINHGNYSAKTQLGVAIIGMIAGSALDRPAQALYQFRYAVKMPDGSIAYHDKTSSDPFRHPSGACVMVPSIELSSNQKLCTITIDSLRKDYIKTMASSSNVAQQETIQNGIPSIASPGSQITCKIGVLAPIATTTEKCNQIKGRILND